MPDIDQRQIARWVEQVAATYNKRVGTINYIFVDDERILEVNRPIFHFSVVMQDHYDGEAVYK